MGVGENMAQSGPSDEDISKFKDWLLENGAKFEKIDWPSSETIESCRGAQAVDMIETNEVMMEIPIKCMMRPDLAVEDPQIGRLLHSSQDLLRGDVLLCVHIMTEVIRGEKSFYAPYIRILPEPGSIVQWKDAELDMLQDDNIVHKAKNRRILLRNTYQRSVVEFAERFPEDIDIKEYTYERFLFAWFCIQARAFGRRLPWTAMVPFADCLNHSNVQTKYDYDIGGNGVFRMYPTGSNSYAKGTEVFNSYGRRPNDNLLLDYGFSMRYNMWDSVEILLHLERDIEGYPWKSRLLLSMGKQTMSHASIERLSFPFDALLFLRVATLSDSDGEIVEKRIDDLRESKHQRHQQRQQEFLLEGDERSHTVSFDESPPRDSQDVRQSRRLTFDDVITTLEKIVSLESEIRALNALLAMIKAHKVRWASSVEEDEEALRAIEESERESAQGAFAAGGDTGDNLWKAKSALLYRLTRKKIIDVNISRLQKLLAALANSTAVPETGPSGELFEDLASLCRVQEDSAHNLSGAGNESPYHSTAGSTRMGVFNKELDQETRLREYLQTLLSLL